MGGLIGGLFGGGDDGGSSTTSQQNSTLQQNSQPFSYQDPNAPVASFQQQYVRNDWQPQQQGQTLSGMYGNNNRPQQGNQNNYMAKRGGLWSFFGG